ncbi:lysophospholipid acyltransferase family protein [Fusobacterium sp. PH5-44]|uniref:lysophospholipid acyltransferase family protein n=1 Tax=unclassified Fusobacterium TaxID=2648384 RepID=UPI003D207C34
MKSLKYKTEYFIFLFVKKILLLFPEKYRFAFAEFLGVLAYYLIKKRRLIANYNIRLAFPDMTDDEIKTIAKKSYKIMAKSFISSLWYKSYVKNPNNIKVINKELALDIHKKGRGIIGATMHFGNIDMASRAMHEYNFVAIAKRQKNPYINRFITESREKYLEIKILQKSKNTVKEIIEYLKKGYIIGLFSDHRDKGTTVNFFGKETIAPTGAISLALKYNIPLVFAYTVFNTDNTCTVHIEEEIILQRTDNFKKDVHDNTQMLIHKIEEVIIKNPEQWMWFHDRWNIYKEIKNKNK